MFSFRPRPIRGRGRPVAPLLPQGHGHSHEDGCGTLGAAALPYKSWLRSGLPGDVIETAATAVGIRLRTAPCSNLSTDSRGAERVSSGRHWHHPVGPVRSHPWYLCVSLAGWQRPSPSGIRTPVGSISGRAHSADRMLSLVN